MRFCAWAGAAAATVLLQMAVPQQPVLLTIPQRDAWAVVTGPPQASVSADGRYVALASYARLLPADTNDHADIYVLDRETGNATLESATADGDVLTGDSTYPRLSGDGTYLVFQTVVTRPGRTGPETDIVVRNRIRNTATRVSRDTPRRDAIVSRHAAISEDGRVVVFASASTDLVEGADENGTSEDVFAFDTTTHTLRRISLDGSGRQVPVGASFSPSISGDGRYVAFTSTANLDDEQSAATAHPHRERLARVFVRDLVLGMTTCASVGTSRTGLDGASNHPSISRDGRYVAFVSEARTLARRDRNRSSDVFVRDMEEHSTTLVSRGAGGGTANGASGNPAISADGRFVAFQSDASDLICARRCDPAREDTNLLSDVFLLDRLTDEMTWISKGPSGGWPEQSGGPQVDATAAIVTFTSRHPIDDRDVRNDYDLFVRVPASSLTRAQPEPMLTGSQSADPDPARRRAPGRANSPLQPGRSPGHEIARQVD
jgi:Tol biopolymer transport system component